MLTTDLEEDLCFADDKEDQESEELLFQEDEESHRTDVGDAATPWKILIVDDEKEVHSVTCFVLRNITYKDRPLHFISAYSAKEAQVVLNEQDDIAVILLDVVMETEHAGLELARWIREVRQNRKSRIVLRTGQPGQAPERHVIVDYDINDYKAKTELTADRMFTTVIASLRSYDDLLMIEKNRAMLDESRRGLQMIIDASTSLLKIRSSFHLFAKGVLTQLCALLDIDQHAILCVQKSRTSEKSEVDDIYILAGFGRYEDLEFQLLLDHADQEVRDMVLAAFTHKKSSFVGSVAALYLATTNGREMVVYVRSKSPAREIEHQLIKIFFNNISVGFDNIYLFEQLRRANRSTIVALADLAEHRDTDTGAHVLRVAYLTEEIAKLLKEGDKFSSQLDDFFVDQIGLASMLHDIGKVAIPDSILRYPGPLSPENRTLMETHTTVGSETLANATQLVQNNRYLTLGAEIAEYHHEWFDGRGYPHKIAGDAIPLSARIVAVADVFDALTSERPYKAAWPIEKAVAYIHEKAGTQFDPDVVAAFSQVMEKRKSIPFIQYNDEFSIGISEMDADHQILIRLLNEISHPNLRSQEGALEDVINQLIHYVGYHFHREESLFNAYQYPDTEAHCQSHRRLTQEVETMKRRLIDGSITDLGNELFALLSHWLTQHILQEDRAYAQYILKTGA